MVNTSHMERPDLKIEIFRRLFSAEGAFVSGQEISQQLGVSRTSVWKHLQALQRDGCQVEAVPRSGYRLLNSPDLLLPFIIQAKLKTRTIGQRIYHFTLLESTQAVAHRLAQQREPEGAVVIAEEQTGGRGRWGRSFFSPPGGLWFSLILRPPLQPQAALSLTLLAGVAVAEAIRNLAPLNVVLKWPNDILIGSRKAVGMLGEMIAEVDVLRYVVLGIGVNVNVKASAFPRDLKDIATSLSHELGREVSRSDFLVQVLERTEHYYGLLLRHGARPVLDAWRSLPSILGSTVSAETPEGSLEGKALDIDDQGALIVQTAAGEKVKVLAGDVHLLRQKGKT